MLKTVRSQDYKKLLALLIAARKRAGLSQREIAKAIAEPQSWVSKGENGERRLDLIELVAILRALGLKPRRFIMRALREIGVE